MFSTTLVPASSDKVCDKVSGKGRLKWDLSAFNMSKLQGRVPWPGASLIYGAARAKGGRGRSSSIRRITPDPVALLIILDCILASAIDDHTSLLLVIPA